MKARGYYLTEEQKATVAKNHNLIYSYANLHNIPIDYDGSTHPTFGYMSNEDWYGTLATGLCKAVILYDKTRGAFSTFAYKCMDTEVFLTRRYYRRHNPELADNLNDTKAETSADERYAKAVGADRMLFKNNIFIDDMEDEVGLRVLLEEEYKKVGKYGEYCRKILEEGCHISDLAKEIGVSRQALWQCYHKKFLPSLQAALQTNE